jgi:hypothetical protein
MKNFIQNICDAISRIIYRLTPHEFRKRKLNEYSVMDMYVLEEREKCYNHFKKYFKNSMLMAVPTLRNYAIKQAIKNETKEDDYTYLEFGVYKGDTANFFSKYVNKLYAFDSFEGLREDWVGWQDPAGTFNLDKKVPKLNTNVIPIVGWVQDTLDNFLEEKKPKINFVHMDMDTYETSKFILTKIKPYLNNDAIILFDDLWWYPGWDVGEYKALKEVFNDDEYEFKAFAVYGEQVVIKLNLKNIATK